jgi:hypothetical protein
MKSSKKQTRKVGVAGGFINQMMGNNSTEPKVGEGATLLSYSDRHANEVIEVSDDGSSCKIRAMECTYVGSGYGDERYTYKSDPEGGVTDLEWNEKKSKWCIVWYETRLIKALQKRLFAEHDYDMWSHLPNGLTFDDLLDENGNRGAYTNFKLIDGVTKRYKRMRPVSVIFGVMEQYRDPSF